MYPCMQASAPFMSGFIAYLIGISTTFLAFKNAKKQIANAKYITAAALLVITIGAAIFTLTNDAQAVYADAVSLIEPNQPIGLARGINPGRVVWAWNPDATNENCTNSRPSDGYWKDKNTDLKIVEKMMLDAVNGLVGNETIVENWDAIFHHFNKKHNKGNVGYVSGEKLFIKVNLCKVRKSYLNDDYSIDSTSNNREYARVATSPQTIIAIVRQLVNECGIADSNITMGDPHKNIFKHLYDPLHTEFPGLIFLTHDGGKGRLRITPAESPSVFYSDHGTVLSEDEDYLCKTMEEADYMINIAAIKGHAAAGVTMNAKNHFGSIAVGNGWTEGHTNAAHLHDGLVFTGKSERTQYGMYRVLVDLMGHKYIGENTLLFVVDGLWSAYEAEKGANKWKSAPFNNDYPSSIFVSQDNVAMESVCYDFLKAEYNLDNYPEDSCYVQMNAVDDYIIQAADSTYWPEGIQYDPENDGMVIPSLGVFEHWNNAADKQYSRNLSIGDGIELVKILKNPNSIACKNDANPASFKLYKNYPSPFNPSTIISYELPAASKVKLEIYDINGKKIDTLIDEKQSVGFHQVTWNAQNSLNGSVSSGIYIYRIKTGEFSGSGRLVYLK